MDFNKKNYRYCNKKLYDYFSENNKKKKKKKKENPDPQAKGLSEHKTK